MSFTPLDILYIVLAFCALWLSAAMFWLVWQVATMLRNVNSTIEEAREKLALIEQALTGMKTRFEKMTSLAGVMGEGIKALATHLIEKKFNDVSKPKVIKKK
ncbi:MAG: hypothetical protein ABIH21_00950 [Patescibacteria group bacterium]